MQKKTKLFNRLFITTAVAMAVGVAVALFVLSVTASEFFSKEKKSVMLDACSSVSQYCTGTTDTLAEKFESVYPIAVSAAGCDMFVTDPSGRVISCSCNEYTSDGSCTHSKARIKKSVLSRANSNDRFELGNFGGSFSEPYYISVSTIKNESGKSNISGYVFCVCAASSVRNYYYNLMKIYIVSTVITLILMFAAQYFSTLRIRRPLKQMSQAAIKMSKGDFSQRIPVTGNDELGELAVAFNRMTTSLAKAENTRSSFIANVSHELKTPMTTISGFVDGILDGTIPPEKQPYYLEIISNETKRLSRVVQSMLSLARLESGASKLNLHNFDISGLVCAVVVAREQSITEKDINILGLDGLTPIYVRADRDLIHQVVYNLVDNAVKFTENGGYIEFSVTNDEKNTCCVKIKNSGKGIPHDALPLVFDRFYKQDRSRSLSKNSTGLGLYLAKTIIELHNGKISVNSKENEFVEFKFYLPSAND